MNAPPLLPKPDLHVHTTFSDGHCSVGEAVQAAVAAGVTHLGICDHFRTRKLPPEQTLLASQVEGYAESVHETAAELAPGLAVWAGLEVDFCPDRTDFRSLTLDIPWEQLDFVLFEYVGDELNGGAALAELLRLRADIPCRVGLAHNDLGRNFARLPPVELLHLLEEGNIFVELCCGERSWKWVEPRQGQAWVGVPYFLDGSPYHHELYRRLADTRVLVSTATDAHAAAEEIGRVDLALRFVAQYALQGHLLTPATAPASQPPGG